ncbi:ATPase [Kineococcus sp. NUM-3379]
MSATRATSLGEAGLRVEHDKAPTVSITKDPTVPAPATLATEVDVTTAGLLDLFYRGLNDPTAAAEEVLKGGARRGVDRLMQRLPLRKGATKPTARKAPRPSPRGYVGAGRGRTVHVPSPLEWRGTSVQVCGLYPFSAGSGTPMVGVPIGKRIESGAATGETVCADPVSWFRRTNLISNPSVFVIGLNGLGKSTFIRRTCLGMVANGVRPLFLGDLKPDYVDLTEAIGGQVLRIGRGVGGLNPLDPGAMAWAVQRLSGKARDELRAELRGRQATTMNALLEVVRREPLKDYEESAVSALIDVLGDRQQGVPVVADMLEALRSRPEAVRTAILDRGKDDIYDHLTERLERSLIALLKGAFGDVFSGSNSESMSLDAPAICMDTSRIKDTDPRLEAAALLTCWSHGFGTVRAMQELADAGVIPWAHYFAVLDELWRILRAGVGMAGRIDAVTRLNRQEGFGQAMITHTTKDFDALERAEDRDKARGFIERAGYVATFGAPQAELDSLNRIVRFSQAEQALLTSWATPSSWSTKTGRASTRMGEGKCLLKIGERPGIPVQITLTDCERSINDTNKRWELER